MSKRFDASKIMDRVRKSWNPHKTSSISPSLDIKRQLPKLSDISVQLPKVYKVPKTEEIDNNIVNVEEKLKNVKKITSNVEEKLYNLPPPGMTDELYKQFKEKTSTFYNDNKNVNFDNKNINIEKNNAELIDEDNEYSYMESPDKEIRKKLSEMKEEDLDKYIESTGIKDEMDEISEEEYEQASKKDPFGYIDDPLEKEKAIKEADNLLNQGESFLPNSLLASYALYRNTSNSQSEKVIIKPPAPPYVPRDPESFLSTAILKNAADIPKIHLKVPNRNFTAKRYAPIKSFGRTRLLYYPSPKTDVSSSDPNSPYFLRTHPHSLGAYIGIPKILLTTIKSLQDMQMEIIDNIFELRKDAIGIEVKNDENLLERLKRRMFLKHLGYSLTRRLKTLEYWQTKYPDSQLSFTNNTLASVENSIKRSSLEKKMSYFENLCFVESTTNPSVDVQSMISRCRRALISKNLKFTDDSILPTNETISQEISLSNSKRFVNFLIPSHFLSAKDRHYWNLYKNRISNLPAKFADVELSVFGDYYAEWVAGGKSDDLPKGSPLYKVVHLPGSIQSNSPYSPAYMEVLEELIYRLKKDDWVPVPVHKQSFLEDKWTEMLEVARPFIQIATEDGQLATRDELWQKHIDEAEKAAEERRGLIREREEVTDELMSKYENILTALNKDPKSGKKL